MTTQPTKGTKMDIETRAGELIINHIQPILNTSPREGNALRLLTAVKSALQAVRDDAIEECDEILISYYTKIKEAIAAHNNGLLKTCLDLSIEHQESIRSLKERKEI